MHLSGELGGPAIIREALERIIRRCKRDAVLQTIVAGIDISPMTDEQLVAAVGSSDAFVSGPLAPMVARLAAQPASIQVRVDMIVGHAVAVLVDLNVGGPTTREVVRRIAAWRPDAQAA